MSWKCAGGMLLLAVLVSSVHASGQTATKQSLGQSPIQQLTFNTTANYVFVTSTTYPANLGGVAAYDAKCNQVATGAGINNVTNDAFIAWMSDSSSNAIDRLGSPRGFVTTEGRPFADTVADITSGKILNPIRSDENGNNIGPALFWTATNPDGKVAISFLRCSDWNTSSGQGYAGSTYGGPGFWTAETGASCGTQQHLACFQKTNTLALTYTPAHGRTAFVTQGFFAPGGGVTAADNMCQSEASGAGLANPNEFVAYLSTTITPASLRIFANGDNYVRPDGIVVGTPAQLASSNRLLESGIWQFANGGYLIGQLVAYTGSVTPDAPGTAGSTCSDYTSTSGGTPVGFPIAADSNWWGQGSNASCSQFGVKLYCLRASGNDTTTPFPLTTTTARTIRARKGQPFTLAVASFTDTDSIVHPNNYYSASINWGDGSVNTMGTIVGNGTSIFQVMGNHAYQTTGAFDISVQILDQAGASAAVTGRFRMWPKTVSH